MFEFEAAFLSIARSYMFDSFGRVVCSASQTSVVAGLYHVQRLAFMSEAMRGTSPP